MLIERRDRVARSVAVAALAWGGTILGHLSSYAIAFPSDRSRAGHLAASGHGSFEVVSLTAAAAAAVGVGLSMVRALRSRGAFAFGPLARVLAAIQVPAFALLETAERGFDPGAAVADPVLALGMVVQVVVAALVALAVVALARSVRAMLATGPPAERRATSTATPGPAPFVDRLGFLSTRPLRAPPFTLAG